MSSNPNFTPAHLLGHSPSMSSNHRLLTLNTTQYKISRSLDVYLCLMDVNILRLNCVFSWSEEGGA
jgi:hypothetical protein